MAERSRLEASIQYLKGVGPRRAERFARLGVETGRDLAYHVPHRYEDATTVRGAASLRPGDDATVIGRVVARGVLPTRTKLRIFRAVLRDESGHIECAWPGQPWLDRQIRKGDLLLVTGPVGFYHGPQLRPREFTVLSAAGDEGDGDGDAGLVFPVYRATEGLGHRQIRKIVDDNLDALLTDLRRAEPFSPALLDDVGIPSLDAAIEALHRPSSLAEIEPARRRLAYEELFFLQLLHARARLAVRAREGHAIAPDSQRSRQLLEQLPFRLTSAQSRVLDEIRADQASPDRMYRLLHGDVGSGKTIVAALAMLAAVDSDRQAILMAPTELLAEQHADTLTGWFEPLGVPVHRLVGSMSATARAEATSALAEARPSVVVGTQALIQGSVEVADPGLVVIDEQHRFGVDQRRALTDAGCADVLVMSATPIPRSLALALYGDLDVSTLDELPPGRQRVTTAVRPYAARSAALEWLSTRLAAGEQAYVVYPLIDESDAVDAAAATAGFEELSQRFPEHGAGLLHGRLPAAEKETVMRRFCDGELRFLVSTTVIEVGIDVPAATVMWIEHAERFGLAQLHQLRGRVGRGGKRSYCVAFHAGEDPPERLRAFAATRDGFRLALEDLRLRGQGDFFGREQHGAPGLRFADLSADTDLLEHARRAAQSLVQRDPELSRREHRTLARTLAERYSDREGRFGVG